MSPGPFGSGSFGTGLFSDSPLFNTKDIIDSVLRDTGHSSPASETNKRLAVLGYVNNRYARVSQNKHFNWLYQDIDFLFNEPYATGTISMVKGSNIVTGSGTAFSAAMLPYFHLLPGSTSSKYVIESVTSATELVLEGEAAETVTNVGFKIVQAVYELPEDLESCRAITVDGYGKLVPIGVQELRRRQASNPQQLGAPAYFSEVGRREEDGVRYIEVFPAPDITYSAHLSYSVQIMKLEDLVTSYPLIPDRHRVVLYYGALAEMFRFLRDQEMATSAERDFDRCHMSLLNDTQLTDSQPAFHPARNYRNRTGGKRYKSFMDRDDFGRFD